MVKKIWNFITTAVLVVMLFLVAIMFVPRIFGIEPMVVLSGSMEPTYHVGSLLYVKDAIPKSVEVGDTVTYHISGDTLVTHRVVEKNDAEQMITTKGDANDTNDSTPIRYDAILGIPVFNIPKLGFLAFKLSSTSGKIIYVTVIAAMVILMYMADLIWPEEKKVEKKNEGNKE